MCVSTMLRPEGDGGGSFRDVVSWTCQRFVLAQSCPPTWLSSLRHKPDEWEWTGD